MSAIGGKLPLVTVHEAARKEDDAPDCGNQDQRSEGDEDIFLAAHWPTVAEAVLAATLGGKQTLRDARNTFKYGEAMLHISADLVSPDC